MALPTACLTHRAVDTPACCAGVDPDDSEPRSAPTIVLDDQTGGLQKAVLASIGTWAPQALRAAGAERGEVRVRLLNDTQMACAHATHLDDPSVTDVITFDLADGASAQGAPLDIDLLVCADEAARQAQQLGLTIEQELVLYILHGVLHCLGYDDHTEADARAMHRREDEILVQIGLGAAYAPKRPSPHA